MKGRIRYFVIMTSFLLASFATPLSAQNEIIRERASLVDLHAFGFTTTVEGPRELVNKQSLLPKAFKERTQEQLKDADLQFIEDSEVESSADIPFLYMHVNMMQLDNGLIPFSIQLQLYQPVKLALNNDLQTSASTWETGTLGIVSTDQIEVIIRSADLLIDDFLHDLKLANPDRTQIR